jgi:cytochrome b6-f complex iron-sulfur subunit
MERKEFFSTLVSSAAVLCLGSLAACTKSSQGGYGGPISPFTVDLSSQLTGIGASIVSGNVIVIRIAAGNSTSSFVALSNLCTHQGCAVNYIPNQSALVCPCHGAKFNTSGSVTQGPASTALTQYSVSINGNTLTVS